MAGADPLGPIFRADSWSFPVRGPAGWGGRGGAHGSMVEGRAGAQAGVGRAQGLKSTQLLPTTSGLSFVEALYARDDERAFFEVAPASSAQPGTRSLLAACLGISHLEDLEERSKLTHVLP